jgi:predicted transcriptional regulator
MQTIQKVRTVEDEQKKWAILDILSDKYCRQILSAIKDKPKSIMDIYLECKVPTSTLYRRIKQLHDNKLVSATGLITDDGKKYFLYKSKIRGITSSYLDDEIKIQLVANNHPTSDNECKID